jgi:hypothetical protein
MVAVIVNWTQARPSIAVSGHTSLSHFSFLRRHSRQEVIMRFRRLMRACFVAADATADLGLDWLSRSQPSSEKFISACGILPTRVAVLTSVRSCR